MKAEKHLRFIFILLIATLPASVVAALNGKAIAMGELSGVPACTACHGTQGQGNAQLGYPYLAGQPDGYLVKQIRDYVSGKRKSDIMRPVAMALTEPQIRAVAEYYSSLPLPEIKPASNTANNDSTGKEIAHNGKWSESSPACYRCHGDHGQGIAPHFPAIAGQPEEYLKTQLTQWQSGERNNDHGGFMRSVVAGLTQAELNSLAQYISGQTPTSSK